MSSAIRTIHYSSRTEKNCVDLGKRFLAFQHPNTPAQIKVSHIAESFAFLAVQSNVAVSTSNQALNAIAFFNDTLFVKKHMIQFAAAVYLPLS